MAIVLNHFYSGKKSASAIARCGLEIAKRTDSIILTNGKYEGEKIVEGIKVYQIKGEGINSFKRMAEKLEKLRGEKISEIFFVGGIIGAICSVKYFKKLGLPIILNLYSYKARLRDYKSLYLKDFFLNFRRIFRHYFFYTLFIPEFVIKKYFSDRAVKEIIVASDRLKKIYEEKLGRRIYKIPPGVDLKRFRKKKVDLLRKKMGFDKKDKIILYSGLSSFLRGIDNLIYVFKKLDAGKTKVLLTIYSEKGDSVPFKNIEKIKKMVGGRKDVKIITKPLENIEDYYNLADLAVFMYRFAGDIPECPLTMIEFMACEKPVIAGDVGAIGEYAGKCPVVNPKDKERLKDTIKKILEDNGLREKLGQEARRFIEREHDWDKNVEIIKEIVNEEDR